MTSRVSGRAWPRLLTASSCPGSSQPTRPPTLPSAWTRLRPSRLATPTRTPGQQVLAMYPPGVATLHNLLARAEFLKKKKTRRDACHCCQLAFFSARFHKTGIFQKRLALENLNFIYCLALKFYLLFGIEIFFKTVDKALNLAFFDRGFWALENLASLIHTVVAEELGSLH